MANKKEVTTNEIMEMLMGMKMASKNDLMRLDQSMNTLHKKLDRLDKKFETKFDLLFDAVGDINEKFTVMDYKFLQLKRHVQTT